jgi:hypothetical protein
LCLHEFSPHPEVRVQRASKDEARMPSGILRGAPIGAHLRMRGIRHAHCQSWSIGTTWPLDEDISIAGLLAGRGDMTRQNEHAV